MGNMIDHRTTQFLGGLQFTCLLLLWLGVLVFAGTLYQVQHGLFAARQLIFDAWFVWLGPVPLPAGNLVLAGLMFNMSAAMIILLGRRCLRPGVLVLHAGLFLLVVSGAVVRWQAERGSLILYEGEVADDWVTEDRLAHEFPFSLHLSRVQQTLYPESRIAAAYTSDLLIEAPGKPARAVTIEMNRPLKWGDITLYQSKYFENAEGKKATGLAVVRNPAKAIPAWATGVTALGFAVHFLPMLARALIRKEPGPARHRPVRTPSVLSPRARPIRLFASVLTIWMLPLSGAGEVSPGPLGKLTVQAKGRTQPLLALAEQTLLQVAGQRSLHLPNVCTEVVHAQTSEYASVFAVENKKVDFVHGRFRSIETQRMRFRLQGETGSRCWIQNRSQQDARPRLLVVAGSTNISAVWEFPEGEEFELLIRPASPNSRQTLALKAQPAEGGPWSTLGQSAGKEHFSAVQWLARTWFRPDLARLDPVVQIRHPAVLDQFGFKTRPGNRYSFAEIDSAREKLEKLVADVTEEEQTQKPGPFDQAVLRLRHSFRVMDQLYQLPDSISALQSGDIESLRTAWEHGDQKAFDDRIQKMTMREPPTPELKAEYLLVSQRPFFRSRILYLTGLLFLLLGVLCKAGASLRFLTRLCVFAGFVLHASGLGIRMFAMQRPPVTNLYSTFLFVAWGMVLIGLIVEWRSRNQVGLLAASIGGWLLLGVAGSLEAEGDSMGVLVAVLNSNFWLSTHVICILLGYVGCLLAGLIGHIALVQLWLRLRGAKSTLRTMYGCLAFGLALTFIGTMLGGVWADQSWGRFWGWDPKENGALLIVIWSAILFHARLGGFLSPAQFAAGCVFGNVVVLFAWVGTNLLGTGLHAYGFTQGLWTLFFVGISLETAFIAIWLVLLAKHPPCSGLTC